MNYYEIKIESPELTAETIEIIIAMLGELPFETFDEQPNGLLAYISEQNWTQDIENQVFDLSQTFNFNYKKTWIAYQNWNQIWETNFNPIQVADFVAVRADFHAPTEGVQFDLVINPKMAFGTGHHETTYMMMQMMRDIDFNNKKVFDYGCGTGILAILASKLRASDVVAVDIEQPSYENTIENAAINDVHNIRAFHGTLENVPDEKYDVILANINRNVILNSLISLKNKLNEGGLCLLSGFLNEDKEVMTQALIEHNFSILKILDRGKWLCFLVK